MSSEDKAILKLQIEKELREKIETTAEKEGLSVSAWVRRTILCHFSSLEAADIVKKMIDSQHPTPPTPPPAIAAQPKPAQNMPNNHPCTFLNPTVPPQWRAQECQGVCQNPSQSGRVCFWASNVARQCQSFRPKRVEQKMGERRP